MSAPDCITLDEALAELGPLLDREARLCALAVPAGIEHRLTCARADVRRLRLRAEPGSSLEGLADRLAGHLEALWLQLAPTAGDLVRAGLDVEEALERVDRAAARMGRTAVIDESAFEREVPESPQEEIDAYYGTSSGLTRGSESVESVSDFQGRDGATDSLTPTLRVSESESVHSRGSNTDSDPESVTPSERPFALPIREFIALERPTVEPLLADADGRAVVGRHSLTLMGASGGHGKTTFDLDVLMHMAAGVDYPPWTVPTPVASLIIENEGPEELFAQKLEERLATFPHELKARLAVHTFDWGGFSLANEEHCQQLFEELAIHDYDLVFGDPLDSLGIEGVGSPEDTREFLKLMKRTGLHRSIAWWLNTHPRKEKTSDELDEVAGAWGGKPDSVFLLRRLAGDRMQLRQPKLRWARRGRGPTLLFDFDPDTEAFTYLGEESDEERDYLGEVKAFLADGRWLTTKEIAAPKKPKTGKPGIGANVDIVKALLEANVDVFESRTGDAAKALGRSAKATVWRLVPGWAEFQGAALALQRATGVYKHPTADVAAEMERRRAEDTQLDLGQS